MRKIRSQGVILLEDKVLIARHYNYKNNEEFWLLPGGSLKENETSEEALIREIKEETNLDIAVKEILLDLKGDGKDFYNRYITYLCKVNNFESLELGYETNSYKKIIELVWVSLKDEMSWNEYITTSQFYPSIKEIKERLIELKYI